MPHKLKATKTTATPTHMFDALNTAQHSLLACAQDAKQTFVIYSRTLAPALYGQTALAHELSRLARRHRNTHVRLLIENTTGLYGKQHPLITLSQQLPSHITIRRLNKEQHNAHKAFCIADQHCLLQFTDEAYFQGQLTHNARALSQQALNTFNQYWDNYSQEDAEFKQLTL